MATSTADSGTRINLITFNCWGLKYLAAHRHARLCAIGDALASSSPAPDIVALQECWTQADYSAIRSRVSSSLPHSKFYHSGILGSGLAVFSRWPIVASSMYQYPLNGRPTAFFRGDWFVGKGVACTDIALPGGRTLALFNTHLHAPYEREPHDSYLCHRTAQAWELAKLLSGAAARGCLAVAAGDFNMLPGSLAHRIVSVHGGAVDAWAAAHDNAFDPPGRSLTALKRDEKKLANIQDSADDGANSTAATAALTVGENIARHGTTCDSAANTWRWSKARQRALAHAKPTDAIAQLDADERDPRGKRLDYVFVAQAPSASHETWQVERAHVGMTQRHPSLLCSLSDHFSVETTLRLHGSASSSSASTSAFAARDALQPHVPALLSLDTYTAIETLTSSYVAREIAQRRWRVAHFGAALAVTIACHVAVWWAAPAGNSDAATGGAAFALMFVASFGLAAGLLDGLIGGMFVAWEMSALREFEWEVGLAKKHAGAAARREAGDDGSLLP